MRYFLRLCLITLCLLSILNAFSQDWLTTRDIIVQAKNEKQNDNILESLRLYLTALQRFTSSSDTLALIQEEIGTIYQEANLHEKALEYFTKISSPFAESEIVKMKIGASSFALQQYKEAEEAYNFILTKYSEENIAEPIIVLEKLNEVAHEATEYEKALEIQQKMLLLSREIGDSLSVAIIYNNIGYDLKYLEKFEEANKYFNLALARNEELNLSPEEQALTLINIGIVNQNQGKYEEALNKLLKSEAILKKQEELNKLAYTYEIISSVYFNSKDFYNARVYADKAKQIAIDNNLPETRMEVYELSSLIYQEQEEFQLALADYRNYLALKDSLGLVERIQQELLLQQQRSLEQSEEETKLLLADQEVKELEAKRQKLELEKQAKELEILKQNQALQQSELDRQELQRKQAEQQVLLIRKQLEAEKQQNELADLRQKEAIQKAELEAQKAKEAKQQQELALLEQEKENIENNKRIQDLELQTIKSSQKFFIGIAVLGSLITLLIIYGFWNTRKKNKLLAGQNDEIEAQNTELNQLNEEMAQQQNALTASNLQLSKAYRQITDSVKYAQRIQNSILEPIEKIQPYFEDIFIYFKPRDIVSGDFYWFSDDNDDKIVITAVDCTGHGVPGAFMSLIGNESLSNIINKDKITSSDEILNRLTVAIKKTLKKDKTENRDGMDMALCVINKKEKTVEFSGAKNPLLIIQGDELRTIKGDRMPIGGSKIYGDASYTSHKIELDPNKENYFYLFSDGFQDQFGGPEDRKFTIKRFRNLLQSIYKKPMWEQQDILEETLKEWMDTGNTRQLDDILVIGFKL